jgi:hypothetical protein
MVNKNGANVMPEAGQFAIGFDALPFFGYVGDMFNNTANNNLAATYVSNNSGLQLYGKYFLSESTAIRGRVRLNQNISQDVNRVFQDGQANPQSNIEVEDEMIASSFILELGGGMEWRRSKGRIVGVYGGEAFVGLNTSSQSMTYGNAITQDNQSPTTTVNFNSGASAGRSVRTVSVTNPNSFSAGARGFAGIEYFFAPQISIGAEFYLGLSFTGTNRSEVVTEEWDAVNNDLIQITDVNANILTQFGINTSDYGGAINLLFHF